MTKFLVLQLTDRCNLSCVYCYMDSNAVGMDMTESVAHSAIHRFCVGNKNNTDPPVVVELSGGEPLLRFELIHSLVQYGKTINPNIRFAVQTNGVLLDREKIEFIIQNRIGLGLSLDGVPNLNDQLRGKSRQVMQALQLLDEYQLGTNITVVLTRQNIGRFDEFLMLCGMYSSIKVINLDLIRPLGRAFDPDLIPEPEQVKNFVKQMISTLSYVNAKRQIPIKIREVEQFRRRKRQAGHIEPYCYAAEGSSIVVSPDGRLGVCSSLMQKADYGVGHIDSSCELAVKRLSERFSVLDQKCLKCDISSICRGGCPSRKIAYNGNPTKCCDIECKLRREIYRQTKR